ncbi:MAG: hypothetical protein U9R23_00130 [Candidatus Cloacimonadota bacterium]|nr:hypothetical protein [Candidatus Cloacimonadota bacterium]
MKHSCPEKNRDAKENENLRWFGVGKFILRRTSPVRRNTMEGGENRSLAEFSRETSQLN